MPLTSLSSSNESGEIKVDATQHTDLPGIKNTTTTDLRVSLSATGTWCLYNVPSKDPALAVFNAQTDWKGYQLPKDIYSKHKWRQPGAPAGSLLVELYDAKGDKKSVLAAPDSVEIPAGGYLTFVANDDPAWYQNNSGQITLKFTSSPIQPAPTLPATALSHGTVISLKSVKGDFLHRPAGPGVGSWYTGLGNEWTVEVTDNNKIRLRSWRNDYLYRSNTPSDFPYPTQSPNGVTTRGKGEGDEWSVEVVDGNKIRLRSFKDDFLNRPDVARGANIAASGSGCEWVFTVLRPASPPPAS